MAQPRGFRQDRGSRRKTSWELGPGDCTETEFSATGAAFVGMALTPTVDGLTLVRLRGRLHVFLSVSAIPGTGFCGAFGIGIATVAAVTAGAASVPTPITEQGWDGWIYWTPIQVFNTGNTLSDGVNAIGATQIETVDSKAMRKLREEDAIYAAIEFSVEEGATTVETRFDSRILAMLP